MSPADRGKWIVQRLIKEIGPAALVDCGDELDKVMAQAIADDRENCARIVEGLKPDWHKPGCGCDECMCFSRAANAIRNQE